ncbi:MAG: queuosine precursor transporter [Prevotella sp.]|nr:queuosine precursor transporter [Prevotella sp.]
MAQRQALSVAFVVMGMLFCICLVTSNLLETKIFHLVGPINLTCGFIVFPISYILNDCIAEVWGYRKARLIIWLGFVMNFLVVAFGALACLLPPITKGADAAFREVFGFAPQVVIASFIAFLVGSFLNAWVMSVMKLRARGKGRFAYRFSLRAIASTVVGEGADSLVFFPLAFYLLPWLFEGAPKVNFAMLISLMLTQVVAKTLYEVVALPITIRVVRRVKKLEGVDVFDEDISYNPLKIKDL